VSRYFSRPRAAKAFWVEDDLYDTPTRPDTPSVDEHVATETGLLDKFGDPIWRAPNPMGFGKDDEW
jgi:hypothetical protein